MSRPIVLGWVLWLLGSWTVNWLIDGPAHVTDITVTPVVRWTIIMAMIGLSTYWPLIRLSQPPPPEAPLPEAPPREPSDVNAASDGKIMLADVWGLMLVFQVIVWPMRFLAGWTIEQALIIDAAVVMHAMLMLVCIITGRRGGNVTRLVMMGACLAMLIGPCWFFASRSDETALGFSPLRAVWVLADRLPFIDATAVITRQLAVIAAALIVAGVLIKLRKSIRSAESADNRHTP